MEKWMLIVSAIMLATVVNGATYYVSIGGSDSNTGTQVSPFRTIQKGVDMAQAGDTVVVKVGDYSSASPSFETKRAGSAGNFITIKAADGETVSISRAEMNHDYTKVQGFRIEDTNGGHYGAGIVLSASNAVIEGNTFLGGGYESSFGISTYPGGWQDNVLIKGNRFLGEKTPGTSFQICMYLTGSNYEVSENYIFGLDAVERVWETYGDNFHIHHNEVADCPDSFGGSEAHPDIFQVFSDADSSNILIEQNYFHDFIGQIGNLERMGAMGEHSWTFRNNIFAHISNPLNIGIPNVKAYNNLFYDVLYYGHADVLNYGGDGGQGSDARNNAFIGCAKNAENKGYSNAWEQGNNFISNSDGTPKDNLADKMQSGDINGGSHTLLSVFDDCTANDCDFRIGAGSALIDKGIILQGFSDDYLGASRLQGSAWDIGPYEYGGKVCTPGWSCSVWSSCVNYKQTRTCSDTNGCEPQKTETQSCGISKIEAESGTLIQPFQTVSDNLVSGGKYIQAGLESGTATYSIRVATLGRYKIVGRVFAENAGTDSLYFSIDNAQEDAWDFNPMATVSDFNIWRDDEVTKRGTGDAGAPQYDPYIITLSEGTHIIQFRGRESGARLDYFYLVPVGNCIHDSDTNCDGCVRQDELLSFISDWKSGQATLANLMEAIGIWKNGC